MSALSCAALAAAIAAAQPGSVLSMAPDQTCTSVKVRNQTWDQPVTLVAKGVVFRDLHFINVRGLNMVGGQVEALAGMTGSGVAAYGMLLRNSHNIQIKEVTFTNAVRGLVVNDSHHVLVEDSLFHRIRADGINLATASHATVRNNIFRDFLPLSSRCTFPDASVVEGMAARVCKERQASFKDGDHPDGVQLFGHVLADIEITGNRMEGDLQSVGIFNGSFKDTIPTRIRINDNHIRSLRGWGISLQNCVDCEAMRNDVGRSPGGKARVQINVTGSTGRFCGNTNPDAPQGHPTVQRC